MATKRRLNINSAAHLAIAERLIKEARQQLRDARNLARRDPDLLILKLADAELDLSDALHSLRDARENNPVEDD